MADNRRTDMDIMVDILSIISAHHGQIKPTHLMYKSNLTYKSLTDHVAKLVEKELLQRQGSDRYHITDKGLQVMQEWKKMKEFLSSMGL